MSVQQGVRGVFGKEATMAHEANPETNLYAKLISLSILMSRCQKIVMSEQVSDEQVHHNRQYKVLLDGHSAAGKCFKGE